MIWALWSPLPIAVVLLAVSPLAARRVPPRLAAPALASTAVLTAAATLVSCALLAGLALVRLPGLGQLIAPRSAVGAARVPGVLAAGSAATLLVVAMSLILVSVRRHLADRRLVERLTSGDAELVVLRDSRPAAYAVGGWPGRGRVVATTAMLAALSPPEREVLLAHEQTHLRRGHHHMVLAGQLAALVNPLLRGTAARVKYLTERDADEAAARVVGDRHLVARALSHAALASLTPPSAGGLAFQHANVVPRVRALLAPEPALTLSATATLMGLLALAVSLGYSSVDSLHDADRLLELLRSG